ncbi:MAG: hypothetical protein U0869_17175 [Chloroflexota bacterium]
MRRPTRALPLLTALTAALLVVAPVATHAQSPSAEPAATPSPFCAVLTADEVTAALGVDMTVGDSSDQDCSYQSDVATTFVFLSVSVIDDQLDNIKTYFADGSDVTVADQPGVITSDGTMLFLDTGDRILSLQLVGTTPEMDSATILESLAATALPRLADIPLPSPEPAYSPEPLPSFVGDPELVALLPTFIGEEQVQTMSLTGNELLSQSNDPYASQQIADVLAGIGKSMDDMSIALGFSSSGAIYGIRVKGADAAAFEQGLVPLIATDITDPVSTDVTISGKTVQKITDASDEAGDNAYYLYANGEILWFVQAIEPGLSEIFAALP